MAGSTMISLRLPAPLAKRLDKLAEATDRSRSYVATKAIEEYVESEEQILEKIREGLADADAGRLVSHEKAVAWVARLKSGGKPEPPRAGRAKR